MRRISKKSGGWKADVDKFDLAEKSNDWCITELRMLSGNVNLLRQHSGIPPTFRTANRDTASGIDALCMLLYKLSSPRNYHQLRATFGGSAQRITRIANALAVYLHIRFRDKLASLDRDRLTDLYLMDMARAQFKKNGLMQNIVGFIDATVLPCCRPITPSLSMFL